MARQVGELVAHPPAGHAFEAVDQLRQGDLGREVDEQVDVVVLAVELDQFGFEVDANGYVRNNSANASRYMTYCSFLSGQAEVLNSSGAAFMWRDLDGVLRTWRAVHIERAMY